MATTIITRKSDENTGSSGEPATKIAIQDLSFFTLTAARTAEGILKLTNWRTGDTVPEITGDSGERGGPVSEIAVTRNLNRTVTAVRDLNTNLRLISWDDENGDGNITQLAETTGKAGAVLLVTIAPGPAESAADLITAVTTGGGTLKLFTWALDSATGTMTQLGDSGDRGIAADILDLTVVDRNFAVTAMRGENGHLQLISWSVSADGTSIEPVGDSGDQAKEVSEISIAGTDTGMMVTAVRDGSENLKLISWQLSGDGTDIQRLKDTDSLPEEEIPGTATRIRLSHVNDNRFVTAVRAGNGWLKLISWDVDPNTGAFDRTGDSGDQAKEVSEVTLATPVGNNSTTAVRDGSEHLKLITWRMEDQ